MITLGLQLGELEPDAVAARMAELREYFQLECVPLPAYAPQAVQVTGTAEAIEEAVSKLRGEGIAVEPIEPRSQT